MLEPFPSLPPSAHTHTHTHTHTQEEEEEEDDDDYIRIETEIERASYICQKGQRGVSVRDTCVGRDGDGGCMIRHARTRYISPNDLFFRRERERDVFYPKKNSSIYHLLMRMNPQPCPLRVPTAPHLENIALEPLSERER